MTDAERETESTDGGLDRRTVLKGTAVAGLAGTGAAGTASATEWNEIVFTAATEGLFEYWFEVSGKVKRGGPYQSDAWDKVGKRSVHGAADEKKSDSFLFSGDLEKLRLKGLGKVFVNGELIEDTSKEAKEDEKEKKKKLPNTITIESEDKRVEYKFKVAGHVEKGPDAGEADKVDGNTVRGAVYPGDVDDFRYSGAIVFDKTDGPLTVTLELNDS